MIYEFFFIQKQKKKKKAYVKILKITQNSVRYSILNASTEIVNKY